MLYDNVKRVCSEKGVSVGYVEKQCELSNGSISKWNENEPGIRKVQKVAEVLGVPIEKLLEDELERKGKKPTFNDIRKEHGLGPVEGGDAVLTKE